MKILFIMQVLQFLNFSKTFLNSHSDFLRTGLQGLFFEFQFHFFLEFFFPELLIDYQVELSKK